MDLLGCMCKSYTDTYMYIATCALYIVHCTWCEHLRDSVHSESFSCALFPDLDLDSVCTLYITCIAVYIVAALIPAVFPPG